MSMARPGQSPEALAAEMLEQGKISHKDVNEIEKFAEFLRVIGPAPSAGNRPVEIPSEWAEYVGLTLPDESQAKEPDR